MNKENLIILNYHRHMSYMKITENNKVKKIFIIYSIIMSFMEYMTFVIYTFCNS